MKKILLFTLLAGTAFLFSFKTLEQGIWDLDKAHAKLGFTITHMMVSDVEGWIKITDAKLTTTKDDFSDAVIAITADMNSVNTDNEKRDAHLKSADFFEVTKYPSLTFKSTSFTKVDDKNYKLKGDLTMHGVTKPVELNAMCRMGISPKSKKSIAGFKVTGIIKRSDFGVGASMSTTMLSDEVNLVANAEFDKQ
jgi:polyisoprenoid-binding protein YceI